MNRECAQFGGDVELSETNHLVLDAVESAAVAGPKRMDRIADFRYVRR